MNSSPKKENTVITYFSLNLYDFLYSVEYIWSFVPQYLLGLLLNYFDIL